MPKTEPFDLAVLLNTPEAQADYLSAALAEGDLAEIEHPLALVARARGKTSLAVEDLPESLVNRIATAEMDPRLADPDAG